MHRYCIYTVSSTGLFDDDTITEVASNVPTREEIKRISQAIVKQNTHTDEY